MKTKNVGFQQILIPELLPYLNKVLEHERSL